MTEIKLNFDDNDLARLLYGDLNKNLATIEKTGGVSVKARGNQLTLKGLQHEVELASLALQQLYELIKSGYPVYPADVAYGIRILERSSKANLKEIFLDKVYITANQRVVSPKSINQKKYIDNIRSNDIVFGIGPAGTGKTYLAVAMAISALASNQVKNIILTRPAVEAGEKLGFLPGDMAQKVDPYLRPLYDALHDMLGREKVAEYIERGIVEIAPLAFMRGRTLNSACPNSTTSAFLTKISTTLKSPSASISFISFIASTIHSALPLLTLWPISTKGSASGPGAR